MAPLGRGDHATTLRPPTDDDPPDGAVRRSWSAWVAYRDQRSPHFPESGAAHLAADRGWTECAGRRDRKHWHLALPRVYGDPLVVRGLNVRQWGLPTGRYTGRAWRSWWPGGVVTVSIFRLTAAPNMLNTQSMIYCGPAPSGTGPVLEFAEHPTCGPSRPRSDRFGAPDGDAFPEAGRYVVVGPVPWADDTAPVGLLGQARNGDWWKRTKTGWIPRPQLDTGTTQLAKLKGLSDE